MFGFVEKYRNVMYIGVILGWIGVKNGVEILVYMEWVVSWEEFI